MKGQKLKFMPAEPISAPEKLRMRNTEKSNIGCGLMISTQTKTAKLAADAPRMPSASGLPKPMPGPCVMK